MYNCSIIRSDPTKINKGRTKKIHISIVMDEMEGHINRLSIRGQIRSSRT
jgi:hypothetical protein